MKQSLPEIIRQTTNARLRIRYLAISHFKDGKSRTEISKYLKVSRGSINKWVTTYLKDGLEGLSEKPRSGRPHWLTDESKSALKNFVLSRAEDENGGRLNAHDIIEFVKKEHNVAYSLSGIYRVLHQLNLSWITSRSKHPKQDKEKQEEFKKNSH